MIRGGDQLGYVFENPGYCSVVRFGMSVYIRLLVMYLSEKIEFGGRGFLVFSKDFLSREIMKRSGIILGIEISIYNKFIWWK